MNEVSGEQPISLRSQEGCPLPARGRAPGRWAEPEAQDPANSPGTDPVAEAAQFAMDAPEAPALVVRAELDDQVAEFVGHRWPTCDGG